MANGHEFDRVERTVLLREDLDALEGTDYDNRGNQNDFVPKEGMFELHDGVNMLVIPSFSRTDVNGKRKLLTSDELQDRLRKYEEKINAVGGNLVGVLPVSTLGVKRTLTGLEETASSQYILLVSVPSGSPKPQNS